MTTTEAEATAGTSTTVEVSATGVVATAEAVATAGTAGAAVNSGATEQRWTERRNRDGGMETSGW